MIWSRNIRRVAMPVAVADAIGSATLIENERTVRTLLGPIVGERG